MTENTQAIAFQNLTERRAFVGYIPALDGLRAIGALTVMAMHCGVPFMKGGFLGVDLFFVLSGYLITTLILREVERRDRFSFVEFYFRRTLRLLPALTVVCLFGFFAIAFHKGLSIARLETLPAILYVSDFTRQTGWPTALGHTWSLSLEEQFYVVWPLTLVPALYFQKRKHLIVALLAMALFICLWRYHTFNTVSHWSRAYDWPDVHSDGILIGCAAALVSRETLIKIAKLWIPAVIIAVSFLCLVKWGSKFSYQGGIFIFSIACAVLIAKVVTSDTSPLSNILSFGPLMWIGQISYGLYLWHFLILGLLPSLPRTTTVLVVFSLSFTLAALMRAYVEIPFLSLRNINVSQAHKRIFGFTSVALLTIGTAMLLLGVIPH